MFYAFQTGSTNALIFRSHKISLPIGGDLIVRKDDSFNKASLTAQKTMALLKDRKIRTIPQNYTIWYEYLSEENPKIIEVVNRLMLERGKFSDEVAKEIFNEFFSFEKEGKELREANRLVQQSMQAVLREIQSSSNGLANYGEQLDNFADTADGLSLPDLQSTVRNVIAETKSMAEQSHQLNDSLKNASDEISALKLRLEQVESETLTDPLTGIANRKKFDTELRLATGNSKKSNSKLCLIMSDIDHFKNFNDEHGHVFGDQVLKLVAQTLDGGVKNNAVAARYGGEEFGIILPGTSLEHAAKLADSLRTSVSEKKLVKRNTGADVGRITMSFGVAQFSDGESIDDLIARADTALYQAKNAGRDQVKIDLPRLVRSA